MGATKKITGADLDNFIRGVEGFDKADVYKPNSLLEKLFDFYAKQIKKELKKSLQANKKTASGNLKNTVEAYPIQEGNKAGMVVLLEPYYKYVNDGRIGRRKRGSVDMKRIINKPPKGPTPPPFEAISKWVRFKAIKELSQPGLGYKTRQTARVGGKVKKMRLVERIRWGIYWNGIKPTYFYTDTINEQLVKNIEEDIYKLLGKSIELNISNGNYNT